MKFVCGYCHHLRSDDPSLSMSCRACNADRGEACRWAHGISHDSRRAMTLHWNFDKACPYQSGGQPHAWVLSSSIIAQQNGDAP